ncbi:MAG: LOG family protein, partial [Candidatus Entotheonellia bacterium]
LTTVLKMHEDGADLGNLKLANTALKELRYAFKVFEPYRDVPKVTVFGSARTGPDDPTSVQARRFARSIAAHGWMVMTGAGSGVMGAAQEGAGIGPGFGLHIRLPWEAEANPWIAEDPKLISFKYFFTRKLFLVKEASAACLLPGGFGTLDEAFEVLTLVQTGKTALIPVVLLDAPGDDYWRVWEGFIRRQMLARKLIAADDLHLLRITDDVEEAVAEICGFYRNFHSSRFVGDALLLRVQRPLPPELLSALQDEYADILKGDVQQYKGPLPAEGEEWPDLWRLILPFNRSRYGRLRLLIDSINRV